MACGLTGISTVDLEIANNVFWTDTFQFGDEDDFTWSFAGKHFLCDVKRRATDTTPLLALSSAGGTLIVQSDAQRILAFYVSDLIVRASLPVGRYVYDVLSVDNSTGQRDMLMTGNLEVVQGVTIED